MNVVLTQPVEIALRALSEEDRRKVSARLDHLKDWKNDPVVREQSHKLESSEGVYVVRTGTDLRIFFSLQEGQIVVLDIARKGTIKSFGPLAENSDGEEWDTMNQRRAELIRKKSREELTEEERAEFEQLQRLSHETMERKFPRPRLSPDEHDTVKKALGLPPEARGK